MFVLKLRSFSVCPRENCNNCFCNILPLTDFKTLVLGKRSLEVNL